MKHGNSKNIGILKKFSPKIQIKTATHYEVMGAVVGIGSFVDLGPGSKGAGSEQDSICIISQGEKVLHIISGANGDKTIHICRSNLTIQGGGHAGKYPHCF